MNLYSSLSVARYFVERAAAEGRKLTNLELQKLVYFAHGWHLAIIGQPLIDEFVEAWDYGPVAPELYHALKPYGSGSIPKDSPLFEQCALPMEPHTTDILESVWKRYKGLTPARMVALTHQPRSPWSITKKRYEGRRGADIPDSLIEKHFLVLAGTSTPEEYELFNPWEWGG